MANPWLATREDIANALDVKSTARDDDQIDRLIEAESRNVERFLHRKFAPTIATRYVNWPNSQFGRSYRIWLDQNELISLTTLVSGGVTIPLTTGGVTNYFLEPVNYGPPYNSIEMNLASVSAFSAGSTHQRSIAITGLFGYSDDAVTIGTQTGSLNSTDDIITTVWAGVGVGSILKIDSERMICTDRSFVDTTRDTTADLASLASATLVATNGSTIYAGEEILIDSERMLVTDIINSSSLLVKRAWSGTALAAHSTGASIYSARAFTVQRGSLGTTATTHSDGTSWTSWVVPGPVRKLTIAEVINTFEQEQAGYARVIGSGEGTRNASGAGLDDARMTAMVACGRRARQRAV